jgi:hypothetical protein
MRPNSITYPLPMMIIVSRIWVTGSVTERLETGHSEVRNLEYFRFFNQRIFGAS